LKILGKFNIYIEKILCFLFAELLQLCFDLDFIELSFQKIHKLYNWRKYDFFQIYISLIKKINIYIIEIHVK